MVRFARRLAAAVVALGLCVGTFALAPAATAAPAAVRDLDTARTAAAASEPVSQDPLTRLGGCLAGGGTGDVVMLFDESESIRDTDPDNARVTSAKYFVSRLAAYAAQSSSTVRVQVAAFSQQYTALTDWTSLEDGGAAVQSAVDGIAQRNDGWETDYWSALDGARRALASAASGRTTASCQAVVWFSDGELWYNPVQKGDARKGFAPDLVIEGQDAADRARDLARQDLCRGGGLADQLRTSGVLTFGIGLDGPGVPQSGFDLMESIVAGTAASGQTCGDVIHPTPGTFFRASDIDSLLMAFDQLGTPGQLPLTQHKGVCQSVVCADQGHRVVLDSSTPRATILATSDAASATVSVQGPSGSIVEIPRGSAVVTLDGAKLTSSWPSDRTVSLELDSAGSTSWKGLWQLAFTDPTGSSPTATSTSHVRVQGVLVPVWPGSESVSLHSGDVVRGVPIGLGMRDGSAGDARMIEGSVSFSAVLRDSAGTETIVRQTSDPAEVASGVDLDLTGAAVGAATMTLTSRITTAATQFQGTPVEGTVLEPESVTIPLTILPPVSYPVAATSVDFGTVEAEQVSMRADLPVTGDGCIELGDVQVLAGPADIGRVEIRSDTDGCLRPTDGVVALTLTTEHSGNGTLNGILPLRLKPSADGTPVAASVSFSAGLARPIQALNFWLTLVVALLLGPGLPLGILFLLKWASSTVPARLLYGFVVPVQVNESGVLRDGRPFTIAETDLSHQVSVPRGARRLNVEDILLRVRIGASPFGRGAVVVDAPGRDSVSSATPGTDRSGRRARLPLNVHNHWVILRAPGTPRGDAQLLVLLGGPDRETRERLERSIAENAPTRLRQLIEAEEARGAGPVDMPESDGNPFAAGAAAAAGQWTPFTASAGDATTSAPTETFTLPRPPMSSPAAPTPEPSGTADRQRPAETTGPAEPPTDGQWRPW